MQTKKYSLIESITNTFVGFMVSLASQLIIYPAMNIKVTFSQNIKITLIFTIISISRGYIIRRFFNRIKK